jgi:hypothetical protein
MEYTGYVLPDWQQDQLAHGYRGERDWGTLRDHPWAEDGPYWNLRANGGILSTVGDLYKWHVALQGETILDAAAKEAYYKPHVAEGEGAPTHYGYGWSIATTPRRTRLIAHNGGNRIFSADFLRYIDEDVAIIVLANTSGKSAWTVSEVLAKIAFGYEYKLPSEEVILLSVEDLQGTEIGRRALALLDIYTETDVEKTQQFIQENCAPDFIERATPERLLEFIRTDQEGIGEAVIGKIEQTGETTLELTVKSQNTGQWWLITLIFQEEAPFLIRRAGVVDTTPPT